MACLREVGLSPERLFDTELAARLLGLPRVGLGTVAEELLGIHLKKEHSAADWSVRPLPASWLEYAALDVELLVDIRDALAEMIVEQGKEQIAEQEFEAARTRLPKAALPEPWRKISGLHSVRAPRQLAIARSLWLARDDLARTSDIAPGRLIPDSSLVAAVRLNPSSKRALAGAREFSGRASRTELDRWWDAIEAGRNGDVPASPKRSEETLPPPRAWADRNPGADRRLKAARSVLSELSDQHKIPLENLLTPEYLRKLAWAEPSFLSQSAVAAELALLGARRWQIELTSQSIAQAFVDALQEPEDDAQPESSN